MQRILRRIQLAARTLPKRSDWLYAVGLLAAFGLVYLPIGFWLGFLTIDLQTSWQTIASVTATAFLMPGLTEELGFRVLLIPHPSEPVSLRKRQFYIALSLLLFVVYHLHPFVPLFFRTGAFLTGASLVGIVCTLAYLKSGSLWLPVILHWLIVAVWLLVFGGLAKFQG